MYDSVLRRSRFFPALCFLSALALISCGKYSTANTTISFSPSLAVRELELENIDRRNDIVYAELAGISADTFALFRRTDKRMVRVAAYNRELRELWGRDIPVHKDENRFSLHRVKGNLLLLSQMENVSDSMDVIGRLLEGRTGAPLGDSTVLLRSYDDVGALYPYGPSGKEYYLTFSPDSSHIVLSAVKELESDKAKGYFYEYSIAVVDARLQPVQSRLLDLSASIVNEDKFHPGIVADNDGVLYVQDMVKYVDSLRFSVIRIAPGETGGYRRIEQLFMGDTLEKGSSMSFANLSTGRGAGVTALMYREREQGKRSSRPLERLALIRWDFADGSASRSRFSFADTILWNAMDSLVPRKGWISELIPNPGMEPTVLVNVEDYNTGYAIALFPDAKGGLRRVTSYKRDADDDDYFIPVYRPGEHLTMFKGGAWLASLWAYTTDIASGATVTHGKICDKGNGALTRHILSLSRNDYIFLFGKIENFDGLRLFSVRLP